MGDLTDDIMLSYPPFTIPEPHFVTELDKSLFYAHPENRNVLQKLKLANQQLLLTQDLIPESSGIKGKIRIFKDGQAHRGIECGWDSNLLEFVYKEPDNTNLNTKRNYTADVLVPILTPDSHSFQHFLDGVLPKIIQVLPFLRLPGIKLALQKPRDKVIRRMLAKMHLYDRVIWVGGEEKITSRIHINTCITPPVHPLLWKSMRKELGVNEEFSCELSQCKIILLNRAQSHNGGRNIKNQREIITYLSKRYGEHFLVYKPQTNLAKTKQLFSDARVIIGVHGGALYNLNFAPKDCHVIEILPTSRTGHVTRRLAHTIIWKMASMIGQTYWRIAVPPTDGFDNVILPVERLSQALDKADQLQFLSD